MCRLVGVVAPEPSPVSDLLGQDLPHFLSLACEHSHGWGIAFRTEQGAIESVKEPVSADDSKEIGPLLATRKTDSALLHLRLASPGLSVTSANTHPFVGPEGAFAHNGDFTPSTSLDEMIGPDWLAMAEGDTDSERFSLAVRRRMANGSAPAEALARTAEDVRRLATCSVSLNCLLLTPTGLFAYSEHDPASEVVGRRGRDFFGLNYRRHKETTVVSSTGWPQQAPLWKRLPERHVLEIPLGGAPLVLHGA